MTSLEITLSILLYIAIDILFCIKAYKAAEKANYISPTGFTIFFAVFFPISIFVILVREVIVNDWEFE